jgi:hypothetical protein
VTAKASAASSNTTASVSTTAIQNLPPDPPFGTYDPPGAPGARKGTGRFALTKALSQARTAC